MALRNPVGGEFAGGLALDAGGLEGLRRQARTAPREALGKAIGQFEAMFLQMVLKSMREALPQDGALASETTKSYTAMLDGQLAQKLAERGVGLRQALERQLARNVDAVPPADGAAKPGSVPESGQTAPRAPNAAVRAAPVVQRNAGVIPPAATQGNAPGAGVRTATPSDAAAAASSPNPLTATIGAFIEKFRHQAEAAAKAVGVPASWLLAQAGLESGWGRHQPRTAEGAVSHNLFGIKAGRRWEGALASAPTTEYIGGQAMRTQERFRAYGSYADSFADFARLLRSNPRYAGALANRDNAQAWAGSLQRAGYATDPAYAQKLARAIELVSRRAGEPGAQVFARGADIVKDRA
jgi:flagellar protein FlgJ